MARLGPRIATLNRQIAKYGKSLSHQEISSPCVGRLHAVQKHPHSLPRKIYVCITTTRRTRLASSYDYIVSSHPRHHHKPTNRGTPNDCRGLHGIGDDREGGTRPVAHRPSTRAHEGLKHSGPPPVTTKQERQKTANGSPTPNPGRKGQVEGRGRR